MLSREKYMEQSMASIKSVAPDWFNANRDIKDRTWNKKFGHELNQEDIGKEIKFPNPIPWETEIQSIHGTLVYADSEMREEYYFCAKIDNDESFHGAFYGNVFGMIVYVKK